MICDSNPKLSLHVLKTCPLYYFHYKVFNYISGFRMDRQRMYFSNRKHTVLTLASWIEPFTKRGTS